MYNSALRTKASHCSSSLEAYVITCKYVGSSSFNTECRVRVYFLSFAPTPSLLFPPPPLLNREANHAEAENRPRLSCSSFTALTSASSAKASKTSSFNSLLLAAEVNDVAPSVKNVSNILDAAIVGDSQHRRKKTSASRSGYSRSEFSFEVNNSFGTTHPGYALRNWFRNERKSSGNCLLTRNRDS